jgi:RNA polymerase sigma factor (sigma-70 family)
MRKRFNKEQAPVHFNNYMSSLEDSRIRMGLGNEFEETNRGLCLGYFLTDDPENKIKLRNKLVMHNIKLAHEYLYKKLRVDISIENSIDIFQEINLCLVESVDKCLEVVEKRGSAGVFIPYLTYLLLNGLKKIANKYFDYNRLRKHLLNEDDLPMPSTVMVEEKIRREELMGLVRRYTDERESRVIEGYYFEETTLEELGYCFCLTRERTRQIREKGLKKIREGVEWYEEVRKNNRNNLNILKTCIANDPKIKFVVYDYCDLVIDNCVPLLKHNRTTLNGNIEYLLYKGIDLSEWLFIESGKNNSWRRSCRMR